MIADSGYNNHCVILNTHILNKNIIINPIHVLHPNETSMSSTRTCELSLVIISPTTRKGHVIPSLKSGALFSVWQLYNNSYYVFLDKFIVTIH